MSSSRGEMVLQPNYFTSSVYVNALRDDISTLIFRYHEAYSQPGVLKPFALFKTVWLNLGWNWLQFKVFDNRSRQTFLEVTLRLFLERTVKTEAPFTRVVALFGMYLFYYTQVKDTAPPLCSIANIPIPCDHYMSLTAMPESLTGPNILHLQTHVRYVLSCLKKDRVFFILPKSELGPMNPRELPREIYAEDGLGFSEEGRQKRKGRPARREKGKKARAALESLDEWLSEGPQTKQRSSEINDALVEYQTSKTFMLDGDGSLPLEDVSHAVLERLKQAQDGEDGAGVERLERAIAESDSGGIFGLL